MYKLRKLAVQWVSGPRDLISHAECFCLLLRRTGMIRWYTVVCARKFWYLFDHVRPNSAFYLLFEYMLRIHYLIVIVCKNSINKQTAN